VSHTADDPHKSPDSCAPEADDSSVSRSDFAVFAHELRGALTIISGYNDLLSRPLHEAERMTALEGIRRAVARANALCNQVLEGSAAATAATSAHDHVELWVLAEQVAQEQRAVTGRAILVDAPDNMAVFGDEKALARALGNLVANATKYSGAETVVQIRVFRDFTETLGATAVIEVSDRGPGIPAEDRDRIFEPFERLGRDEGVPGTGLGLAIVRDVVAAHGGVVGVHDHAGGGTTMRIELPIAN
jgi:signal transduction histidine kinase